MSAANLERIRRELVAEQRPRQALLPLAADPAPDRVKIASGQAAWCKENPRPLHPDQEEYVMVALSRAGTG
jgi:hypothetical protein